MSQTKSMARLSVLALTAAALLNSVLAHMEIESPPPLRSRSASANVIIGRRQAGRNKKQLTLTLLIHMMSQIQQVLRLHKHRLLHDVASPTRREVRALWLAVHPATRCDQG